MSNGKTRALRSVRVTGIWSDSLLGAIFADAKLSRRTDSSLDALHVQLGLMFTRTRMVSPCGGREVFSVNVRPAYSYVTV